MTPVWLQIVLAILGLFGIGDGIRLLFFKSTKKAEEAKADTIVKENESKAIESLEKTVEILKSELEVFSKMHEEDTKKIEAMWEEKNELNNDLILCSSALCTNALCPLRQPVRGLGKKYFDGHKENLFNEKPFKDVAAEKGYEIKDCNGRPEVF